MHAVKKFDRRAPPATADTALRSDLPCARSYFKYAQVNTYIRGFTKFGIKVLWRLQFFIVYRTLDLKFQKARTKIEVVLSLSS